MDWHLVVWTGVDPLERRHSLRHVRELSTDEYLRLNEATALIAQFSEASPYAELTQEYARLRRAYEALESAWIEASGRRLETEARDLQTATRSFFACVRTCDDHTGALISRYFGKDSEELDRFRSDTRQVYNCNFAYRLSWELRNASQHAGRVVNLIEFKATTKPDGQVNRFIRVGFDGAKLAEQFRKMKAPVRAELKASDRPLALKRVVNETLLACEWVFFRHCVRIEDRLTTAAAVLEALHSEATADGAGAALVMGPIDGLVGAGTGTTHYQQVEVQRAWMIQEHLKAIRKRAQMPPSRVESDDLNLT